MNNLLLATVDGLHVFERDGPAWRAAARGLTGRRVTSVIARAGVILAGTEAGLYRSNDLGQTWQEAGAGLTERHVRWLAFHPEAPNTVFAGTEPAALFVSRDGGGAWRECPEVAALREQHEWWMPYGSGTGCVRGFAFHGQRGYAAVEVGGLLRSDDGGETWALAAGSDGRPVFDDPPPAFIHPDVHSVAVHPASPDVVYAPTAGGLYASRDGGRSWECLYECYARAVWLDPADPARLVLGPADYVDHGGRIEASRDEGRTWTLASAGLKAPWRNHMIERFTQAGPDLLAVRADGQLLSAPAATLQWRRILPETPAINCAATIAT